jgi:hypothetical protein
MAVDADYIKRFEMQVELLKQLQKEVDAAIKRADDRLEQLRKGVEPSEVR